VIAAEHFERLTSILILATFLTASSSWGSAESVINKCTDGKQITYTDKPCKKLGLNDAGIINKDKVTIVPAYQLNTLSDNETHNNVHQNKAIEEDDTSEKAQNIKPVNLHLDKSLSM